MNQNEISFKDINTLKNALFYSKMSVDEVLEYIEDMTDKKILSQHPYAITQNKDGRFSTYLPDEGKPGKRRKLVKADRKILEREIIKFFKECEQKKALANINLRDFYPKWLEYKSLHSGSSAYMRNIDGLWRKYYADAPLIDRPLAELDEYSLDVWAHGKIQRHSLTKTQYYNMAIIIRQSLELARKMGIVQANPFNSFKVDYKLFRPVVKKADATQVFLTKEQPLIESEAYADFEQTKKAACLAIPFAFQTGLRVSELVSLRWSDINEEQADCIHIQRMEIREQERRTDGTWQTSGRAVTDRTKSIQGNRNVYLTATARDILARLRLFNEEMGYGNDSYIFLTEKGRVTAPMLDKRIRRYCRRAGIPQRGMHAIRRTYISTLIDAGDININYIRGQAGHADERTTYGNYCFNRKSKSLTAESMERALAHAGGIS